MCEQSNTYLNAGSSPGNTDIISDFFSFVKVKKFKGVLSSSFVPVFDKCTDSFLCMFFILMRNCIINRNNKCFSMIENSLNN